jgi:hypothetical protein
MSVRIKAVVGLIALLVFAAGVYFYAFESKNDYVEKNEALLSELALYPGSTQVSIESSSYRDRESGPVTGYGTRATFQAPLKTTIDDLFTFFDEQLSPDWEVWQDSIPCTNIQTGSPCPAQRFLRAARGRQFISLDPSNLYNQGHSFDIYVDHDSELAESAPQQP